MACDHNPKHPFDPGVPPPAPEWALIMSMGKFPEVVQEAVQAFHPHLVANYLFTLAQVFHGFYHDVPVLQADTEALRRSRLQLVAGAAAVMRIGLGLLGVRVPERM